MADEVTDEHCIVVRRYNSDFSCCGIVLDSIKGTILTVASLFGDLTPLDDSPRGSFVEVSCDDRLAVEVVIKSNKTGDEYAILPGFAFLFWRDEGLSKLEEHIFSSSEWTFETTYLGRSRDLKTPAPVDENSTKLRCTGTQKYVLSDLVLIRVKKLADYLNCKTIDLMSLRNSVTLEKGYSVWVVGTPFGSECPSVFYNSVTKGIVSNFAGSDREVIITDARCAPGCEGCPLYISSPVMNPSNVPSADYPHSIVLAPFSWRNGEWTGITIACSLRYLLKSLVIILERNMPVMRDCLREEHLALCSCSSMPYSTEVAYRKDKMAPKISRSFEQGSLSRNKRLEDVFSAVVLVQCGNSWGTGIVLDASEGLLVTCSHVVNGFVNLSMTTDNNKQLQNPSTASVKLSVKFSDGNYQAVQIIYATEKDCPLDFALLKVENCSQCQPLRWRGSTGSTTQATPMYRKGEGVLVVGFPLFASHLDIGPSVTSGLLSKIACVGSHQVLLQSSAAVQCGSSGGALVSSDTGELLGLVTSHVRDVELLTAFPHINFSIPSTLLWKLVLVVKSGNTVEKLKNLLSDQVKNIWNLKRQHAASKL